MKRNDCFVLSGGGNPSSSLEVDKFFFSLLEDNTKILYIPIALRRGKIGYEECYDWFSNLVSYHCADKDIDITMLLEKEEISDFKRYNAVYIGGGNTYKLLNYILDRNLDVKIVEYIKQGGIIYGGSAGAIIMGKDIRTVKDENDKNYTKFEGLNLLDGKSIICHYTESLDKRIFEIIKEIKSEIIALPESSGLVLNTDGKITKVLGDVFVFSDDSKKQIWN